MEPHKFVGRLGAGTAEDALGTTAAAIATKAAKSQTDVRKLLDRIIPTNGEFKFAFVSAGKLSVPRAKYVLAMLEKAAEVKAGKPEKPVDWASAGVTIEHVLPLSAAKSNEALEVAVNEIGNLALLEKKLNHQVGNGKFASKKDVYKTSEFSLTAVLAEPRRDTEEEVRVPTSAETADAVRRAQRALAEIRARELDDRQRAAEEARVEQLARWHDGRRDRASAHDDADDAALAR